MTDYSPELNAMQAKMNERLHYKTAVAGRPERGWQGASVGAMIARLYSNVSDLRKYIEAKDSENIFNEAADVANQAMIIADVCKVLLPHE